MLIFLGLQRAKISREQTDVHENLPCRIDDFVYFSCMPTKTITLEIDAYEKLKAAKRGGESFTEVVRRAVIPATAPTGTFIREYYRSGGGRVSEAYLDSVEKASSHDPVPEDPWA